MYVTGEKMEITFFPDRGSNPVRWTQSPTLYHVAIKAGLYCTAVQVYHIPIPVAFSPSKLKFVPEFLGVRESREMRLEEFYAHMWVIYGGRQRVRTNTGSDRIGLNYRIGPDRTRFSVLWSFFLRYFILYAQLEEVYSIQNYFYLTPSFQYKKKRTKHNSTHIYIAKRLM